MEYNSFISIVYSVLLLCGRSYGLVSKAAGDNDFMICRPVTEVFRSIMEGKSDTGFLAMFRGPQGPQGHIGKTGSPGPKSRPDNSKVLDILHDKLQSLNAKLFSLESDLAILKGENSARPTESADDIKNAKACMDQYNAPLSEGTMCYALIGGYGLSWDFEDAENNCTRLGGYVADLNSRSLYNKVYDYVDKTYSTLVTAWTGMRFQEDKLMLTNGTEATYSKWMPYYPKKSTTSYSSYYKKYKYVVMRIDSSSRSRGIENTRIDRKYPYALCHYNVSGQVATPKPKTTTTVDPYFDSDYDYY